MKHVQISMVLKLLCTGVDLYVHVLKARVLIIMFLTRLRGKFLTPLDFPDCELFSAQSIKLTHFKDVRIVKRDKLPHRFNSSIKQCSK